MSITVPPPHCRMEELRQRLLHHQLQVQPHHDSQDVRLTYLPARGIGEIARLILIHAGRHFSDVRLSKEEFSAVKPFLPYGSLPVLEYQGELVCESMAIAQFLAAECGLAGSTGLERARAAKVGLALQGVHIDCVAWMFGGEAAKEGRKEKFLQVILPRKLDQLEARLEQGEGEFLAGGQVTWADLMLVVIFDNLRYHDN